MGGTEPLTPAETQPPDNDLEAALDLFFRPPQLEPVYGWVSTLFLCRKELQDCLIGTVVDEHEILNHDHHRLFATAMVTLAGIELLSQMRAPVTNKRKSFVAAVSQLSQETSTSVSEVEADMLWSFRNALSHTFGLFHLGSDGKVIPIFFYDQNEPAPVIRRLEGPAGVAWEVCIDGLVELFLNLIRRVQMEIRSSPETQDVFLGNFRKHGRLRHRGPHFIRGG